MIDLFRRVATSFLIAGCVGIVYVTFASTYNVNPHGGVILVAFSAGGITSTVSLALLMLIARANRDD